MKLLAFASFAILLHLCAISAYSVDDTLLRVKRSNETEVSTFKKFTNSFKSLGNKITGTATKGYEEVKNLFSRDRKVGDYTLNTIDVRFQEEEDYEEVAVKKPKKTKRETKLKMKSRSDSVDGDLAEIIKDINVLKTTEGIVNLFSIEIYLTFSGINVCATLACATSSLFWN